jgi:hypothetical protein
MPTKLTVSDVLNDIEVELIQGAVGRDELGRSLQAVRQYHNKVRGELFDQAEKGLPIQELASHQFQINDMLLTLLQETIAQLQTTRLELRKALYLRPNLGNGSQASTTEQPTLAEANQVAGAPIGFDFAPVGWAGEASALSARPSATALEAAMSKEALAVPMDVRPSALPVLGWLLTRLRSALHSLSLFYTHRLADRQVNVNQLYGEWLIQLYQANQAQQEQVALLREEIARLRGQGEGERVKG